MHMPFVRDVHIERHNSQRRPNTTSISRHVCNVGKQQPSVERLARFQPDALAAPAIHRDSVGGVHANVHLVAAVRHQAAAERLLPGGIINKAARRVARGISQVVEERALCCGW